MLQQLQADGRARARRSTDALHRAPRIRSARATPRPQVRVQQRHVAVAVARALVASAARTLRLAARRSVVRWVPCAFWTACNMPHAMRFRRCRGGCPFIVSRESQQRRQGHGVKSSLRPVATSVASACRCSRMAAAVQCYSAGCEVQYPVVPAPVSVRTSRPAIFPALRVAARCASLKYAGTVITARRTVCPRNASADSFILPRIIALRRRPQHGAKAATSRIHVQRPACNGKG
jgi:hypothetical protein